MNISVSFVRFHVPRAHFINLSTQTSCRITYLIPRDSFIFQISLISVYWFLSNVHCNYTSNALKWSLLFLAIAFWVISHKPSKASTILTFQYGFCLKQVIASSCREQIYVLEILLFLVLEKLVMLGVLGHAYVLMSDQITMVCHGHHGLHWLWNWQLYNVNMNEWVYNGVLVECPRISVWVQVIF